MEFQGAVYDILDEVVIERSPVIRATREEALQDARALCERVNQYSDDYNGRIVDPDVDAYVIVDGQIEY